MPSPILEDENEEEEEIDENDTLIFDFRKHMYLNNVTCEYLLFLSKY